MKGKVTIKRHKAPIIIPVFLMLKFHRKYNAKPKKNVAKKSNISDPSGS